MHQNSRKGALKSVHFILCTCYFKKRKKRIVTNIKFWISINADVFRDTVVST